MGYGKIKKFVSTFCGWIFAIYAICFAIVILIFICCKVGSCFNDVFIPEGLAKGSELCGHEWRVIDRVGWYDGYKVYCPVCGMESACYTSDWKKYQVDRRYAGKGCVKMDINTDAYFFYEWLILGKGMSDDEFSALSMDSLLDYRREYEEWLKGLN